MKPRLGTIDTSRLTRCDCRTELEGRGTTLWCPSCDRSWSLVRVPVAQAGWAAGESRRRDATKRLLGG